MSFQERYIQFLTELEQIAEEHDELTDTDVRERLHEVINYYFVWGKPIDPDFPQRYAMFSDEADTRVHDAVKSFVTEAVALAQQEGLEEGEARNAALENPEAVTEEGNPYDWFLGSSEEVLPPEKPAPDCIYEDEEEDEDEEEGEEE